jgi:hypothetical protein
VKEGDLRFAAPAPPAVAVPCADCGLLNGADMVECGGRGVPRCACAINLRAGVIC